MNFLRFQVLACKVTVDWSSLIFVWELLGMNAYNMGSDNSILISFFCFSLNFTVKSVEPISLSNADVPFKVRNISINLENLYKSTTYTVYL